MPSLAALSVALLAACTGPYCGADAEFERPAGDLPGNAAAPALAVDATGAVLAVWEQRAPGEPAAIRFARRASDAGASPAEGAWSAPVRLGAAAAATARALEPRLACGAGRVHVVWQDTRDGADDIRWVASTDGGRTWPEVDVRLDADAPGAATSSIPALAATATGGVFVAWEDQRDGLRDIRLRASTDGGATWRPETRVDSDAPGSGTSYHPQLVAWDDGTLLVVWWDERDGDADLYVRRSRDGGTSWHGPERRLDPGPAGAAPSREARVTVRGDTVAVVWEDAALGGRDALAMAVSPDRGARWDEAVRVGFGAHPVPLLAPDGPAVAWTVAPAPGPAPRTSIGGRIRDIPRMTAVRIGGAKPGELEGPVDLAAAGGAGGAWVVAAGAAVGRGVLETFRAPSAEGPWARRVTLLFGESLLATAVPVRAYGPVAVSAGDVLHVAWIVRTGDVSDLGYARLVP